MSKFLTVLALGIAVATASAQSSPCFYSNFGNAIGGGDDVVLPIQSLGFAFPFAGATYTHVHVSTNGLIYLSNAGVPVPGGAGCCAGTTATLVAGGPMICPFWTDLNVITANGANVYFDTNGAFATITWDNVIEYGAATPVAFDMQVQLWINGDIKFTYGPGLTLTTAGDALVGMSPGTPATVPATTDWSVAGTAGDTNFELFNNTALPFDLANTSIFLTATPPNGYSYVAVPLANCADRSNYGTGCVALPGTSFYESFATAAAFDLANTAMTLVHTGSGYLAIPATTAYVAPSPLATRVAIGDDIEQTVTLSAPMRVGTSSSTSQLTICSNGFVSTASGNGTTYNPVVATFLNMPQTVWSCWHDYNQTIAGSGQILFEELGGVAYVSWDGVYDYGTTGPGSRFQMQFELATGNVTFVWVNMSGLGTTGHLVGFSEGGTSADPGSIDISTLLPATFAAGTFSVFPLSLAANMAPVLGTSINLTTRNIPSSSPFGAVMLGFSNPALDLTGLGMAGCTQYTDGAAVLLYFPFGSSTAVTPFAVPSNPAFAGVTILAQSVDYAPAAGLTLLGAVASNGVNLLIGN